MCLFLKTPRSTCVWLPLNNKCDSLLQGRLLTLAKGSTACPSQYYLKFLELQWNGDSLSIPKCGLLTGCSSFFQWRKFKLPKFSLPSDELFVSLGTSLISVFSELALQPASKCKPVGVWLMQCRPPVKGRQHDTEGSILLRVSH